MKKNFEMIIHLGLALMTIWVGWKMRNDIGITLDIHSKKIGELLIGFGGLWGGLATLNLISFYSNRLFPVEEETSTETKEEAQ